MSDTQNTREMGGRVQETVGNVTGDSKTQAQGVYNQAAGQTENILEQGSRLVREQPLIAGLVALGIGFLIGRLTAGPHGSGEDPYGRR
jgi:uncharacterized protein YjbJ (UPF0337 family)